MPDADSDHYATLGLDRGCTLAQIRAAYRLLAKRHHPDVNPDSADAVARAQEINAAHEVLSDPARRRAYDRSLDAAKTAASPARGGKIERSIAQDVRLKIEDFLRGVSLVVRVNDPANPQGKEVYELVVPPGTAPGTRFRIPRAAPFAGGFVIVRVGVLPGFRFKVRGADLRGDLRIGAQRAKQGGTETIVGPMGSMLRVQIPAGVARGEIVHVAGEGMPKPRGGRGDLLVRIVYRPEVRVSRR
ncbi:MAG: DnaJ domain-containing protein [Chthoniobacteraceae bacterium]